jgi:hypothetical protein
MKCYGKARIAFGIRKKLETFNWKNPNILDSLLFQRKSKPLMRRANEKLLEKFMYMGNT